MMLSPPRPKMPFTYVVNVYSEMSLSKGHLGSRGGCMVRLYGYFILPLMFKKEYKVLGA